MKSVFARCAPEVLQVQDAVQRGLGCGPIVLTETSRISDFWPRRTTARQRADWMKAVAQMLKLPYGTVQQYPLVVLATVLHDQTHFSGTDRLPLAPPRGWPLYGVDGNCFKIGRYVLEAMEDDQDGLRSCLRELRVLTPADVKERNLVFCRSPFARVQFVLRDDTLDGWEARDVKTGHAWLEIGTYNGDDCYPQFLFQYTPPVPRETKCKSKSC